MSVRSRFANPTRNLLPEDNFCNGTLCPTEFVFVPPFHHWVLSPSCRGRFRERSGCGLLAGHHRQWTRLQFQDHGRPSWVLVRGRPPPGLSGEGRLPCVGETIPEEIHSCVVLGARSIAFNVPPPSLSRRSFDCSHRTGRIRIILSRRTRFRFITTSSPIRPSGFLRFP